MVAVNHRVAGEVLVTVDHYESRGWEIRRVGVGSLFSR